MKKSFSINSELITFYYYQYKAFIVPILVIVVCIVMIFQFLLPQLDSVNILKAQEAELKGKIANLRENIATLSNMSDETLSSQSDLVSAALPNDKDFASVITAIETTSSKTNISVEDFGFDVGDLSTPSAKPTNSTFHVSLTLKTDMLGTKRFIGELRNLLPLSDIQNLQMAPSGSSVNTLFYYKPFPELKFAEGAKLPVLTKQDLDLLDLLAKQRIVIEDDETFMTNSLPSSGSSSTASASAVLR